MSNIEQLQAHLLEQLNLDETNSNLVGSALSLVNDFMDDSTDSTADLDKLESLLNSIVQQASGNDGNVTAVYNSFKSIVEFMDDLADSETSSNLGSLGSDSGVKTELITNLLQDVLSNYTSSQNYQELLQSGAVVATGVIAIIANPSLETILAYGPSVLNELGDIAEVSVDIAEDASRVFEGFAAKTKLYALNTKSEFETNLELHEDRVEAIEAQGGSWMEMTFSKFESFMDLVGDDIQDLFDADGIANDNEAEVVLNIEENVVEEVMVEEVVVEVVGGENIVLEELQHDEL